MPTHDYQEIFKQFSRVKAMVVGDVMVDAYIFGKVERISPEAPVPVVTVEKKTNRLGGAANVALNLKSLGAQPVLCSVIGHDQKGEEFLKLLKEEHIDGDNILTSHDRVTTTKSRIIGNNAQMLRVDEEVIHDLNTSDQDNLLEQISGIIESGSVNVIILQDYNKGVLTAELVNQVINKAANAGIPVCVDPKRKNFLGYKNVALFKPNLKELREGLVIDIPADDITGLKKACEFLHRQTGAESIMTTLSEKGVFISNMQQDNRLIQQLIPAHIRKISDVSGAGDTVISVAALGIACGLAPAAMAALANLAGGLVCEEIGVVPVNREKLLAEAMSLL